MTTQSDTADALAVQVKNARMLAVVFMAAMVVTVLIFRWMPALDLAGSQYFFTVKHCSEVRYLWGSNYEAGQCGEFVYEHIAGWRSVREFFHDVPKYVGIATLVWLLWKLFVAIRSQSNTLFVPFVALCSLLLGPALIINVFKEVSGRSRPIHTYEFGGFEPFTAAGDFSGLCEKNCSFLSGEASGMFWLLVFIPLVSVKWRWPVGIVLTGLAIFVSVLRVMFGRHFFSDITVSALVSLFSIAVCWWFFASPLGQRLLFKTRERTAELTRGVRKRFSHAATR